MNQSNVIFFFVFAAFFVFITLRGELPKYLGFLLASPTKGTTQVGGNVFTTDSTGKVSGGGNLVPTTAQIESNNSIAKDAADFASIAKVVALF